MNITKINKQLQVFALLLIIGILCSCADENGYHKVSGEKEKLVSFSVGIPGSSTPKTYALNENDENEVKNIVILLFDSEGKYIYQPIYINKIIADNEDSKIKTFTAKVPEGTYKHILVLANSNNIVSNALNDIAVGDSKEDVCRNLLITNNGKWNTNSGSSNYIGIPMWGEVSDITVDSSMADNNSVNLVRMVAKVDVNLSAASQTKFKLKSIRLYNYNDKGQIVPDDKNWDIAQNEAIITAPSVPATAQKMRDPLIYDNNAITTTDISCVGEIYTFEAAAGTPSSLQDNTCLVIGGVYGDDSQETFYRIDFSNTTSEETTYLALLRNHYYKVNITDVSASGLGTAEEAFNSRPVNIKASIVEWNDGRFSDFVVNDQYFLGVSQSEFSFSREAVTADKEEYVLYIVTDYPGGWNISSVYEDGVAPWLEYSKSKEKIYLKPEENKGLDKRTAELHITAERLTYIVKVTQDVMGELDILIMNENDEPINTLEFFSTPQEVANNVLPEPKGFKLRWQPNDIRKSHLSYSSTIIKAPFMFASGSDFLESSGKIIENLGEKDFSNIHPIAITPEELRVDPFFERSTVYVFTVTDGIRIKNKTLTLRHSVKRDTVVVDVKPYYLLGGAYTFNIRSNTGWRIRTINEEALGGYTLLNLREEDNLRVGTMGGYNTNIGTDIHFQTNEKSTHATGKVTLIIESTTTPKSFEDIPVTFDVFAEYYPSKHNGWAGSNIYYDTNKGHLTFDDIGVITNRQYQGVYFQWGSLYGISSVRGEWGLNMLLYPPSGGKASGASLGYTTWGSSPHVSDDVNITTIYQPSGKTVRDRSYLYEITDEATGLGDICKHLTEKGWAPAGKKWRMPTSAEYNEVNNNNFGGSFLWLSQTSAVNETDGKFIMNYGKNNNDLYFPASGYRYNNNGDLANVGLNGFYWSGSPDGSGTKSYMLDFNVSSITPTATNTREYGFSVRCVAE